MSLLNEIFRHAVITRFGWTLVHFLWQGAAVALVLAVALRALRARSADARHSAACYALLFLTACPVLTFSYLIENPGPAAPPAVRPRSQVRTASVATPPRSASGALDPD